MGHLEETRARSDDWRDSPITHAQAEDYALRVPGLTASDRSMVAADLMAFPPACRVRGVFFEGLSRVVAKDKAADIRSLFAIAGVPERKVAFSLYPHRDFYRLYFLAARALYPRTPLSSALSLVSRTFYPIFRESMIGRTMSAFVGGDPRTLLARLADAYNLSVPWNEHRVTHGEDRHVTWRCKVEPSRHYVDIFTGIVTGATSSHGTHALHVEVVSSTIEKGEGRHEFRITW